MYSRGFGVSVYRRARSAETETHCGAALGLAGDELPTAEELDVGRFQDDIILKYFHKVVPHS